MNKNKSLDKERYYGQQRNDWISQAKHPSNGLCITCATWMDWLEFRSHILADLSADAVKIFVPSYKPSTSGSTFSHNRQFTCDEENYNFCDSVNQAKKQQRSNLILTFFFFYCKKRKVLKIYNLFNFLDATFHRLTFNVSSSFSCC